MYCTRYTGTLLSTTYDYIQYKYIVIVMSGPCKLPLYTEINAEHELELLSKSGININS